MIGRISRMMSPQRRRGDAGDIMLSTLALMMTVALFATFMVSMGWAVTVLSKKTQRQSIAQEAVDVALAQAVFALNEEYGVVTDDGGYQAADGSYNRTLPTAQSPATANLDKFNATKQTSFHDVDSSGNYGIQAEARWWVDPFSVTYDEPNSGDQDRVRAAGVMGDLVVEARVVNRDGSITYGYRSVKMPLYLMNARAVQASSDGRGLSYIVSPLSLFQYSTFGTSGIEDINDSGHVRAFSPIASNGDIVLDRPGSVFDRGNAAERRYDAQMIFFGHGECRDYDPTTGVAPTDTCRASRTLNTGFEVRPDTELINQMEDFCGAQGLDDYIASQQANPSLIASDTTYCFRDFVMDDDIRLLGNTPADKAVRIFVQRNLTITDGHSFRSPAGTVLGTTSGAGSSEPQAALYTLGTNVRIEGRASGTSRSKFYLYAPNAVCQPGALQDDPSTTGIDESDARSSAQYMGSIVCDRVVLDSAYQIVNNAPLPDLVEFGSAGFGSDLYPNNLWFVNKESTEFLPRTDTGW